MIRAIVLKHHFNFTKCCFDNKSY